MQADSVQHMNVRRQVALIHEEGAFTKDGLRYLPPALSFAHGLDLIGNTADRDAPLPPGCCFWLFEDRPAKAPPDQ